MTLPDSAMKVQAALAAAGFDNRVTEMPASTRTAADAARACGCRVGQIAKSLIFRGRESGKAVLVIASGDNRVDEGRAGLLLGEEIERPEAAFVREATGFAIGGVPPIGHPRPVTTLIDEDLLGFSEIWAAAGTPRTVFKLTPDELVRMSRGRVAKIA
ncbi:MAG: YbaK/EbsC family protein [Alphaproteobacteria bacterium]